MKKASHYRSHPQNYSTKASIHLIERKTTWNRIGIKITVLILPFASIKNIGPYKNRSDKRVPTLIVIENP